MAKLSPGEIIPRRNFPPVPIVRSSNPRFESSTRPATRRKPRSPNAPERPHGRGDSCPDIPDSRWSPSNRRAGVDARPQSFFLFLPLGTALTPPRSLSSAPQGQLLQKLASSSSLLRSKAVAADKPWPSTAIPSGEIHKLADAVTLTVAKEKEKKYQGTDDLLEALKSVVIRHDGKHRPRPAPKSPLRSPRSNYAQSDMTSSVQTPRSYGSSWFDRSSMTVGGAAATPPSKRSGGKRPGSGEPLLPSLAPSPPGPAASSPADPAPQLACSSQSIGNSSSGLDDTFFLGPGPTESMRWGRTPRAKRQADATFDLPPRRAPQPPPARTGRPQRLGPWAPREAALVAENVTDDRGSAAAVGSSPKTARERLRPLQKSRATTDGPCLVFLSPRGKSNVRGPSDDSGSQATPRPKVALREMARNGFKEFYLRSSWS